MKNKFRLFLMFLLAGFFVFFASTTSISAAEASSGVNSAASDAPPLPPLPNGLGDLLGSNLDPIQKFVVTQSAAHAWVAWIIAGIIALRFVNKPVFAFLHWRAAQTESPDDDKRVDAIEQSTVMKVVNFALDWVFSWKGVPKK